MGTIKNRTIFTGDNLSIMRGIEDESIDLIYLDPPFNSNANYASPIGSKAAGAEFKDTWTLSDIDDAWWGEISQYNEGLYKVLDAVGTIAGDSMKSYSIYMAVRIIEMHRILKNTGSLYLHCDPTASHYLKMILDSIFGLSNFRNEIIWERNSGRTKIKHQSGSTRSWGVQHDVIFFYIKGKAHLKILYMQDSKKFNYKDKNGREFSLSPAVLSSTMGKRSNQEYEYKGYTPKYGWRFIKKTLEELDKAGYIYWNSKGNPYKKMYKSDHLGKPISNIWADIDAVHGKERLGYPTQKPIALLERIIQASSDKDDFVLDPFCGCATACSAAEKLDRRWIGIDISKKAYHLVKERLVNEAGIDKFTKDAGLLIHRTDIPHISKAKTRCLKNILYGTQKGYCNGCKHHFKIIHLTEDHIIPKSKGGSDSDDNIQLLCGHCNCVKGNRDMFYLIAHLKRTKII